MMLNCPGAIEKGYLGVEVWEGQIRNASFSAVCPGTDAEGFLGSNKAVLCTLVPCTVENTFLSMNPA